MTFTLNTRLENAVGHSVWALADGGAAPNGHGFEIKLGDVVLIRDPDQDMSPIRFPEYGFAAGAQFDPLQFLVN